MNAWCVMPSVPVANTDARAAEADVDARSADPIIMHPTCGAPHAYVARAPRARRSTHLGPTARRTRSTGTSACRGRRTAERRPRSSSSRRAPRSSRTHRCRPIVPRLAARIRARPRRRGERPVGLLVARVARRGCATSTARRPRRRLRLRGGGCVGVAARRAWTASRSLLAGRTESRCPSTPRPAGVATAAATTARAQSFGAAALARRRSAEAGITPGARARPSKLLSASLHDVLRQK